LEYDGGDRTAIIDRDWKVIPDDTSEYTITATQGWDSVNEGLARGGGVDTITLNVLASAVDGFYVGQNVFLRSGTGQDQVAICTAYDGGTKVATVEPAWYTQPDVTTGYVMRGIHTHTIAEIQAGLATAAALATHDGKLDGVVTVADAIQAVTDNLPNSGALTNLDAAITSRATVAGVEGIVIDGAVDFQTALARVLAAATNEATIAGSVLTLRNAADDADVGTVTLSAGGRAVTWS
jgi:hypothetical protein